MLKLSLVDLGMVVRRTFNRYMDMKRPCACRNLLCRRTMSTTAVEKGRDGTIRNIGIVAHIDAGKTTTTERMLFYSGQSRFLGEVDHGDTITDYMEQERARGITITSAAVTFNWQNHCINLIDTPGHVDFTMEVERSLRVLDGAVAILDASAGVEAQTLTVWRQADRYVVPRIVYLNKMDKQAADVQLCLNSIADKFIIKPLLTHLPIFLFQEGNRRLFTGVVDLLTMERVEWSLQSNNNGESFNRVKLMEDSDGELWKKATASRNQLTLDLAEVDDRMADIVLAADDLSEINVSELEFRSALRRVTLERKAVPVFCGSSFKNIGVQLLLDAIVDYLPSPMEIIRPGLTSTSDGRSLNLSALVFKICHDKQLGRLCFVRIYCGKLETGQRIHNVNRKCSEKPTKLLRAFADDFRPIRRAESGDIVVLSGTKNLVTGDTLVAVDDLKDDVVTLTGVQVPPPVFFCSIEAASLAHLTPMETALKQLQVEDPSLGVRLDKDTGQTVISGLGELHMEILKDRLLKEYKVKVDFGPLQVAYKEVVISCPSDETDFVFDKVIGTTIRQRVLLTLSMDLQDVTEHQQSSNVLHVRHTKENQENLSYLSPDNFSAVESGVRSALNNGPILGFPTTNASVTLHWCEVGKQTTTVAVSAAAFQCVSKLLKSADVRLSEPVMLMEIVVNNDNGNRVHSVLADLSNRRGQLLEVQSRGLGAKIIRALVPLAEIVGYSTALRTITSGQATLSIEFHSYSLMNDNDQRVTIQKTRGFI